MDVIIENLPGNVDENVLKLIMCTFGDVGSAYVQQNGLWCFGAVRFLTPGAAFKAIERLDGNDIAGDPALTVRIQLPALQGSQVALCVRNLPQDFDNEDLSGLLSPYGDVVSSFIIPGKTWATGYVVLSDVSCAETAIHSLSGTSPTSEFEEVLVIEYANKDIFDNGRFPTKRDPSTPPNFDLKSLTYNNSDLQILIPGSANGASTSTLSSTSSSTSNSTANSTPQTSSRSLSPPSSPCSTASCGSFDSLSSSSLASLCRSGSDSGTSELSNSSDIDLSNVYIHGFPKTWDDSDLITSFHSYGKIVSVRVMRTKNGESRGIGFVRFESAEEAQKAIRHVNGTEVEGKTLTCRIANAKSTLPGSCTPATGEPQVNTSQTPNVTSGIDPTNVYVHGFPKTWEETDLIVKFQPFGTIVSTRVMRDKTTGESRSIGFVKFTSAEEASKAIKEIHSTMEDGKVLVCRIANAGSIGKSPCKYFREGRCNKGVNCTFSHDASVLEQDVQPEVPVEKPEIFFTQSGAGGIPTRTPSPSRSTRIVEESVSAPMALQVTHTTAMPCHSPPRSLPPNRHAYSLANAENLRKNGLEQQIRVLRAHPISLQSHQHQHQHQQAAATTANTQRLHTTHGSHPSSILLAQQTHATHQNSVQQQTSSALRDHSVLLNKELHHQTYTHGHPPTASCVVSVSREGLARQEVLNSGPPRPQGFPVSIVRQQPPRCDVTHQDIRRAERVVLRGNSTVSSFDASPVLNNIRYVHNEAITDRHAVFRAPHSTPVESTHTSPRNFQNTTNLQDLLARKTRAEFEIVKKLEFAEAEKLTEQIDDREKMFEDTFDDYDYFQRVERTHKSRLAVANKKPEREDEVYYGEYTKTRGQEKVSNNGHSLKEDARIPWGISW